MSSASPRDHTIEPRGALPAKDRHTPGPWRVIDPDQNGQPVVSARDYEVATCWHHCVGSIEKEAHANARLIAAAPDLLAALIVVRDWDDQANPAGYGGLLASLRAIVDAAIAKAEGRS